ncbi:nucleoside monophosphate kinase [Patescibacteria group bacterium]|nr:nucleoside monophosphate kinase [Patescibacteria group bacterium]MBU4162447.1 nucleoside monophosphate kinase [Patescibacteria group bacterium]
MAKTNNQQIIIILGPPGAGKGIQATLLADKMGFYYFDTSKIIEQKVMNARDGEVQKIGGKEYNLLAEKKLWEDGILCTPLLVAFWVNNRIKELAEQGESIIFAGSPRTLPETKEIMPVMVEFYGKENIRVIVFELKAEDSIWRNSNRRICELMRHPILFNKETENLKICPLDGSKLIKREKLDDTEVIKIRLEEYKNRTLPIVDYLKNEGYKVTDIDASPAPANVFDNVLKAIK